ncbi:hypothetical protein FOZ63_011250 [Perkinsus olseni]|uniref:Uncharacterized protein n=1 Tax=Perkinsus olseni TaxID=32597 RepID=A0A7J6UF44_PEROL|nr:hypothetical protein FOZ63_011250 [Perkinsus olseni]
MPPLYYLIVVGGIKAAFGQGNDACQQCCSGLKVEAGVLCEVNTKGLVRFADCIWQDMVSAQCFTDCNNCTSMAYEIKQSCLNTCPINHCTVRDITCIRPNECYTLDGTCDTQTGECLFDKQPEGTLCDDGLFYTINDTCIDGQCIGTADICKKLDITCNPPNPCLLPGTCTPSTGDCIYPRKPTGSQCDDGRSNTINDVCVDGLCLGTPTDICQVNGINCRLAPTECHNEGTCNPVDGTCTFDDAKPDGYPCNDGNGKCIAGICSISDHSYDHESYTEGFHMIGIGACSDEDGNIPSGYYKGTGGAVEDISCIAFGWIPWTGNMCIIYTYIRDRPPPPPPPSSSVSSSLTGASNDDDWQWIDGDSDYSRNNKDIVKTVMATTDDTVSTGQQQQHRPYEECWVKVLRRGGGVGADDTVEGRQLWTIRNVITHPAYINALVIIQG